MSVFLWPRWGDRILRDEHLSHLFKPRTPCLLALGYSPGCFACDRLAREVQSDDASKARDATFHVITTLASAASKVDASEPRFTDISINLEQSRVMMALQPLGFDLPTTNLVTNLSYHAILPTSRRVTLGPHPSSPLHPRSPTPRSTR